MVHAMKGGMETAVMGRGWGRWFYGLCLALMLGGCASVFSAQVTRYQQWPENAQGATYWIEADESQRNNLQFQTYADSVHAALGPTGLVEARSAGAARFTVHMEYGSPLEREWRQEFVDPICIRDFTGHMPAFIIPAGPGGWGRRSRTSRSTCIV